MQDPSHAQLLPGGCFDDDEDDDDKDRRICYGQFSHL